MRNPYFKPPHGDELISQRDAFLAMYEYLHAFWERDGRKDDGLMRVLEFSIVEHGQAKPADPAMWRDWIAAIERVQSQKS